ncbi:MAG: hypothetical protein KF824_05440 [Fimbriimonadaceae bacterium]|nr:MAG: hypothetical protein KF824_05440 [Fimbriimonadaceae bacterium]
MQGCLAFIIAVLILVALKALWDWLVGGGTAGIGVVLLWGVGIVVAFGLFGMTMAFLIEKAREFRGRRLQADTSELGKIRYKQFLQEEEKRLERIAIQEQLQTVDKRKKDEDRERISQWRANPETFLLGKLRDMNRPCKVLTVLPGRQAFIAVSSDQTQLILGRVSRTGEIMGTETYRGSKIVAIESGDNIEVTARTRGSGGLVTFGGLGIGSMGSTTTVETEVRSSYILLTVDDMHDPVKQIVLANSRERAEWVGRIRLLSDRG